MQVRQPVRRHGHAAPGGQRRDATELGDAAAHAGIGLQDGGRVEVEDLLEVPARLVDLAGGDRRLHRGGDGGVGGQLVGRVRLFHPAQVVLLPAAYGADRGGGVGPGVVGVREQLHLGTDGGTHRGDAGGVLARAHPAHLDLDRTEAALHVAGALRGEVLLALAGQVVAATGVRRHHGAARGPQVAVQRQLHGLGTGVPQGDVDGAHGAHHRAAAAHQQGIAVHGVPDRLGLMRVAAHHVAGQQVAHRAGDQPPRGVAAVAEAQPLDPALGGHLDQRVVALAHRAGGERGDAAQRDDHGGGGERSDLHPAFLTS